MDKKLVEQINKQIQEEFNSAYVYLALVARLEEWNLKGAANWMLVQAKEEVDHAMGFFRFLNERNEAVKLQALPQPEVSPKDLEGAFLAGLEHEKHITACIDRLYEAARAAKDYPLESFLKWYIDEQVEELATANEMIEKVRLIGKDGAGIYALDQELAARQYVPGGPYAK